MSGTMLGMQDRHAALADAIVDAETRISNVMRQKQESQANRGNLHFARILTTGQLSVWAYCAARVVSLRNKSDG